MDTVSGTYQSESVRKGAKVRRSGGSITPDLCADGVRSCSARSAPPATGRVSLELSVDALSFAPIFGVLRLETMCHNPRGAPVWVYKAVFAQVNVNLNIYSNISQVRS